LGRLEQFRGRRVSGVGVGGGAGFFVQISDEGDAQPHPAEHGVLVYIAQQAVQEDQRQGKAGDAPQQPGQGSVGLYLGQDGRRDEQLGQIDAQGQRREQDAQGQNVLALVPGQRQHEPQVLPDAVFWFWIHKRFTSFRGYCSTKKRPRNILGTKRRFGGTNCTLHLRQQDLGGERAVLAVAADVAV